MKEISRIVNQKKQLAHKKNPQKANSHQISNGTWDMPFVVSIHWNNHINAIKHPQINYYVVLISTGEIFL